MNQLESNLISLASDELRNLKSYVGKPLSIDDQESVGTALNALFAYEQFVMIRDSGLSAEGEAKLKAIMDEMRGAMKSIIDTKEKYTLVPPALEAIKFALSSKETGIEFLRLWDAHQFDDIRLRWPNAPESIFIGVDIFHIPRAH